MTRSGFIRRRHAHEVGGGDRTDALDVGLPGLEGDAVGVELGEAVETEFELGLDGDDPLLGRDLGGQRPQHGRLPGPGCAADHELLAGPHRGAEEGRAGRRRSPPADAGRRG